MSALITWKDFHDLAAKIDQLAVTFEVADYQPLLSNNDTPFPLTDKVPKSFDYWFDVEKGYAAPTILAEWIKDGDAGIALDPPLRQLAAAGELFFVNDADKCWCKTIFQVVTADNGLYELQAVDNAAMLGCCQTLPVPMQNFALDYSQHFIPAGWAEFYNNGVDMSSGASSVVVKKPRCTFDGDEGITFTFSPDTGSHWRITGASRKMSGYFTWAIRRDWMNALVGAIDSILHGTLLQPRSVYKCNTDTYFNSACHSAIISDLQWTLQKNNPNTQQAPGCMSSPYYWPWISSTCGGEYCSGTGSLKVYRATVDQLNMIVDALPSQLMALSNVVTGGSITITATMPAPDRDAATVVVSGLIAGDGGALSVSDTVQEIPERTIPYAPGFNYPSAIKATVAASSSGPLRGTFTVRVYQGGVELPGGSASIYDGVAVYTDGDCNIGFTIANSVASSGGLIPETTIRVADPNFVIVITFS